jgi:hypothetical protein
MGYYRAFDQVSSADSAFTDTQASRYAWLEHEEGIWHFLTSLFAEPMESTRRWSSRQHAFDELIQEGWVIVGSYPENSSMPQPDCGGSGGYGLMQIGHWQCDNHLTAD